jgi:hypothetical protein
MKKTIYGSIVMALAFGLMLAGCDVDGGSEPDPAATQLAADINNRPKSSEEDIGRAEVNGSTVTLKGGFIDLRTNLTVPAGITLDVTADGILGLHDVILTGNGTVNANSNHIQLEDTAAYATINGSGTIHLKGKGRLLEVEGNKNVANRTLTLDGVTLVGVKDNDEPLVEVRSGGDERSGHFIMISGKITGNTHVYHDWAGGGGVRAYGGKFTMQDGEISGNAASGERGGSGGGVSVENGATFTMQGGTISGNNASGKEEGALGGGVNVGGEASIFTMNGGVISGNSANGGGKGEGGGVRLGEGTTFTMTGGEISGNSANGGGRGVGGGVSVYKGTFSMEDGTISGNTVTSEQESANGGGVTVRGENGTFTMQGGTIYGKIDKLPVGTDPSLANSAGGGDTATLEVRDQATAKWGTNGTYTKGDVDQTGGSNICSTDETLIATPGQ